MHRPQSGRGYSISVVSYKQLSAVEILVSNIELQPMSAECDTSLTGLENNAYIILDSMQGREDYHLIITSACQLLIQADEVTDQYHMLI